MNKRSQSSAFKETSDTTEVVADDPVNNGDISKEIQRRKAPDGGWGWFIVLGCLLLRTVVGGIQRSSGLFYVKFLERFDGTASQTAWVSSLSMTVRLLVGPIVSILCNRVSCRKLCYLGAVLYVLGLHVSAYATSLLFLYLSYGCLAGIGRAFVLTPGTLLLSDYFNKRRSLAFGLASAGFGIGGFAIAPTIEVMFQHYGFSGTYILLSGIACELFVCISLFRPLSVTTNRKKESLKEEEKSEVSLQDHVIQTEADATEDMRTDINDDIQNTNESEHIVEQVPMLTINGVHTESSVKGELEAKTQKNETSAKKKLINFSVLKDVRFVTLCIAAFVFHLPTRGLFLPALAKAKGLTDIQTAYMLSIIAGSDTVFRVVSGFVLDVKSLRSLRPYIYNAVSFVQCIPMFLFPTLHTFEQFAAVCCLEGVIMGLKTAQRQVILVDILGVDKLPTSFAFMLTTEGLATLIGPPVAGYLKDTYGVYDYSFYFGGCAILFGAMILACGNIRNYITKRHKKKSNTAGVENGGRTLKAQPSL
ncbi:monocarboxylate transporter 4-like isoform X2 [Dreissena polymorpha]|uniref:monocarboxylate transporter 4-like isoform X2 n=1 Tax=Dreissena polymorpha TaxID=45954 RepID=UPI0022653DBD|nr:monocarboxylate transporter 4-like isoform X2 [Dreissena polymorpha]